MVMDRIIALYMGDCYSRQLRPKMMRSYEQALKLFAAWLEEAWQISQVEQVKDIHKVLEKDDWRKELDVDMEKRARVEYGLSGG